MFLVKKKKKKKKKAEPMVKSTGMEISLSQTPFPALLHMAHSIPENVLFDTSNEIPGLLPFTSRSVIGKGCIIFFI